MTSLKWFCPLVPNRAQKVQKKLTDAINRVDCFAKPDNVTLVRSDVGDGRVDAVREDHAIRAYLQWQPKTTTEFGTARIVPLEDG